MQIRSFLFRGKQTSLGLREGSPWFFQLKAGESVGKRRDAPGDLLAKMFSPGVRQSMD